MPSMPATTLPAFAAAIFDMDGLLLDSERPIETAWIEVARRHGVALDAATYRGAVGLNVRDAHAYLARVFGCTMEVTEARAEVHALVGQMCPNSTFALMPGAAELLALLAQRGVPCAVASSSDLAEIESRLTRAGVRQAFGAIAGGDEVSHGKPAPDLYLLAHQRLGLAPAARALVFEDSEPGTLAGLAAGMAVVLVPGLRPPAASVQRACHAVVPTLLDAMPLANTWFPAAGAGPG